MAKKSTTEPKRLWPCPTGRVTIRTAQELIEMALQWDARIYSEDWTPPHELRFHRDPDYLMRIVSDAFIKSIGECPSDLEEAVRGLDDLDYCPIDFDSESFYASEVVKSRYQLNVLLSRLKFNRKSQLDLELTLALAIDLGMKLGAFFDYLEVDRGRANERAVAKASAKKADRKACRIAFAKAEFDRLMAGETGTKKRTSTLKNMAKVKDENGKLKFGSYATLERYFNEWSTLKSTE